jgi:hypothetical protein
LFCLRRPVAPPVTPIQNIAQAQKAIQRAGEVLPESLDKRLQPFCLIEIDINPESRVKVAPGKAKPVLEPKNGRTFLVRVQNQAGVTAALRLSSPNEEAENGRREHWLNFRLTSLEDKEPRLTGRPLQYLLLRLSTKQSGRREAKLRFDVGQGTQDLGFRGEIDTLFTCLPPPKSAQKP